MKKIIISGMIGNALEWYDYALYAQFTYIIGLKFFPETEFIEILTFAVFAAGFVVSPSWYEMHQNDTKIIKFRVI